MQQAGGTDVVGGVPRMARVLVPGYQLHYGGESTWDGQETADLVKDYCACFETQVQSWSLHL